MAPFHFDNQQMFASVVFIFIFPRFSFQRKLRLFEKKQDSTQKSMDDTVDGDASYSNEFQFTKAKSICSDDESLKTTTVLSTGSTTNTETKTTPQVFEWNDRNWKLDIEHCK